MGINRLSRSESDARDHLVEIVDSADMMPNSVRAMLGIEPVKTESEEDSDEDEYS